jgi:hypothetical protein
MVTNVGVITVKRKARHSRGATWRPKETLPITTVNISATMFGAVMNAMPLDKNTNPRSNNRNWFFLITQRSITRLLLAYPSLLFQPRA